MFNWLDILIQRLGTILLYPISLLLHSLPIKLTCQIRAHCDILVLQPSDLVWDYIPYEDTTWCHLPNETLLPRHNKRLWTCLFDNFILKVEINQICFSGINLVDWTCKLSQTLRKINLQNIFLFKSLQYFVSKLPIQNREDIQRQNQMRNCLSAEVKPSRKHWFPCHNPYKWHVNSCWHFTNTAT